MGKIQFTMVTNGNCAYCGKPLKGEEFFLCKECQEDNNAMMQGEISISKLTWHYVKTDGNPRRKGLYIIACNGGVTLTGRYERGQWYDYGSESESGGEMKAFPYAWTEFPKAPENK